MCNRTPKPGETVIPDRVRPYVAHPSKRKVGTW